MKLTFIGGGNMATAMLGGVLRQGLQPADIAVLEPSADKRAELARQFGVHTLAADDRLPASEVVVLAVKPQQMAEAAAHIASDIADALVISIAAGVRVEALSGWLGGHRRIVRAMPNTPALIGKGISGVYADPAVDAAGRAVAGQVLAAAGEVVWLDNEQQLDPVTAVSGSGPAYVFYFIEALQAAGEAQGFSPEVARQLAYRTFEGAVALALQSEESAGTLRERVTSKGGTTERGLAQLASAGVEQAIVDAVAAATKRAAELGEQFAGQR
ncbi:pyrroline-5-carboxylate reductase [Parachitinimonas caeni]|uniref:Pyrroline-5-carboxylate reductase n=1 Tax=Parachitinimonas caeni TaxID=3031301 RepID=A0ABT7DW38_9NEIS|nr:pyrroline-5-carboxylate reductase [Parachitinimonas caeni]MDK2124256.1 pyrroline-5-carboxylate reductase [Parachitinimonas caeni]